MLSINAGALLSVPSLHPVQNSNLDTVYTSKIKRFFKPLFFSLSVSLSLPLSFLFSISEQIDPIPAPYIRETGGGVPAPPLPRSQPHRGVAKDEERKKKSKRNNSEKIASKK